LRRRLLPSLGLELGQIARERRLAPGGILGGRHRREHRDLLLPAVRQRLRSTRDGPAPPLTRLHVVDQPALHPALRPAQVGEMGDEALQQLQLIRRELHRVVDQELVVWVQADEGIDDLGRLFDLTWFLIDRPKLSYWHPMTRMRQNTNRETKDRKSLRQLAY